MASDAARVALALFLLHTAPSAAQDGGQGAIMPAKPLWALEVLTLESAPPTALWVGLINRSGEARLVCILDRGISYNEKDGTSKAVVEGGSPHACDVDEQFQLVRAGQTLFIRLPLAEKLPAKVSGRIRVELGVVDRAVVGKTSRREPVGVTWEGTLQEAADLGRALKTAVPRGK
jgi:hypothetical protein